MATSTATTNHIAHKPLSSPLEGAFILPPVITTNRKRRSSEARRHEVGADNTDPIPLSANSFSHHLLATNTRFLLTCTSPVKRRRSCHYCLNIDRFYCAFSRRIVKCYSLFPSAISFSNRSPVDAFEMRPPNAFSSISFVPQLISPPL